MRPTTFALALFAACLTVAACKNSDDKAKVPPVAPATEPSATDTPATVAADPAKPTAATTPEAEAIANTSSLPALKSPAAPGPGYFGTSKGILIVNGDSLVPYDGIPDKHAKYMREVIVEPGGTLVVTGVGHPYRITAGKEAADAVEDIPMGKGGDTLVPGPDLTLWSWSSIGFSVNEGRGGWQPQTKPGTSGIMGLAVDGKGVAWLGTQKQLYRRDGGDWKAIALPGAAADALVQDLTSSSGKIYVMSSSGLVEFDGDVGSFLGVPAGQNAMSLKLSSGPEQRVVLVNTVDGQTSVFDASTRTFANYSLGKHKIGSIDSFAIDGTGRVWLAGKGGLVIFDVDGKPTIIPPGSYPELTDTITSMAFIGGGPAIPTEREVSYGTVRGVVTTAAGPAADAKVELCASTKMMMRGDQTPCSGDLFSVTTTTNAAGEYVLEKVPVGTWAMAVFPKGAAKWTISMREFCGDMKAGGTCTQPLSLRD